MNRLSTKAKTIGMILLAALMGCAGLPLSAMADMARHEPMGVEVRTSVVRNEADVVGRLELRCFTDGLTTDNINEIWAEVEAMAEARGFWGETGPRVRTELIVEPCGDSRADYVIVAYGVVVGPDGVPSCSFGVLEVPSGPIDEVMRAMKGTDNKALNMHQRALDWFETEITYARLGLGARAPAPPPALPREAGADATIAGQQAGTWQLVRSGRAMWERRPYGQWDARLWLFKVEGETVPHRNFYAIRTRFGMMPGYGVAGWSSDFRSYRGWPRQDWGWGAVEFDLLDWEPDQVIYNPGWKPFLLKLGLALVPTIVTAAVEWLFEPVPHTRLYDFADTINHRVRWCWRFTQGKHESKSAQRICGGVGSVMETRVPAAGSGSVRIVRAGGQARFRDPHWWGGATYHTTPRLYIGFSNWY